MNSIVSDAALRVISDVVDSPTPAPLAIPSRPFWQTGPCPAWCGETHTDSPFYEDRNHAAAPGRPMDLTLYRVDQGDGTATPATIDASVSQHYRAAEPTVSLSVPTCTRRYVADGEQDVEMTVPEARALRDRLSLLLGLVDADALDVELGEDDGATRRSPENITEFEADGWYNVTVTSNLIQWTERDASAALEVEVNIADNSAGCTPDEARSIAAQLRQAAVQIDAVAAVAEARNAQIGAEL